MKLNESWLREWVNPPLTIEEITEKLTMAGLELDSITPVAPHFEQVFVGEVVTVDPHPNAEKLHVCQVNVGQTDSLTIVCGASNVAAGMKVPVAVIGAVLPGNFKIKKAKLRGVESQGMICSAEELGLADSSEGIMPLPVDAPVGDNVRDYLKLDDTSIEIDLTPNRGDCLGVEGIAREVSVLTNHPLKSITCPPVTDKIPATFPVTIPNPEACPRYVGRVIKNVNPNAETPFWLQERLRRCGLRSISPIVDVTNYVLLELGQPMHAFDFDKLTGGIVVRLANEGEQLALLDGQTVTLDNETLVIADETAPQAMAGVMGGLASSVTGETQAIFLESAFFTPLQLAGCARRYGLHTDSSHRFERGVGPQLQRRACERATALLLDIVGGEPGPIIDVIAEEHLPKQRTITLRANRMSQLLGCCVPVSEVTRILQQLGMKAEQHTGGWKVQPPSFRFDITLEADLIEEIARIYGYNQIPSTAPQSHAILQAQPRVSVEQAQSVLVQHGYQEAITYSFVDPTLQAELTPDVPLLTLSNPIASDMAAMRTTLWTGLLNATIYNVKRQQSRVRLFETGLRFIQKNDKLQQDKVIAGVATGHRYPTQWGMNDQPIDFFDVKADVEALLMLAGVNYVFKPAQHPALHPGQTATIYAGDLDIGIMGALHPRLVQQFELPQSTYLFELRWEPLTHKPLPTFKEISKYPSVNRDIAIVIDQHVNAADILACIQQSGAELLVDQYLFDLYQGKGIEPGKKSVAVGLVFQATSRNLVEEEVDTMVTHIITTLERQLHAQLRK